MTSRSAKKFRQDAFSAENPNPENLDLRTPNPDLDHLEKDLNDTFVSFAQIGQNRQLFDVLNVQNFAVKIISNISVMIAPSKFSKMCSSRLCSRASLFTLYMYASSGARGLT